MKALGWTERPGIGTAAQTLRWIEIPTPTPSRGEVRVRGYAASLNRDDIHLAEGTAFGGIPVSPRPSLQKPRVPGQDFAGVVDAVGEGVTHLKPGDRVFGAVFGTQRLGTLAPYCCTPQSQVRLMPEDWSFAQGAATAFSGIIGAMAIEATGDPCQKKCLVIGASGNIGGVLVQALAAAGAREVVGVCGPSSTDHVLRQGASRILDYKRQPWASQLDSERETFDLVFDCIGGRDTELEARRVLKAEGQMLTLCGPIPFLGGQRLSWIEILGALGHIGWRTLESRIRGPRYTLLSGTALDWEALDRWLLAYKIVPAIEAVHPYEQRAVAQAFARLVGSPSRGKLVIALHPEIDPAKGAPAANESSDGSSHGPS